MVYKVKKQFEYSGKIFHKGALINLDKREADTYRSNLEQVVKYSKQITSMKTKDGQSTHTD